MTGWLILDGSEGSCVASHLPSNATNNLRPGAQEMMNILGTLPAALLLTTFSFSLRSFARVFHTVTNEEFHRYKRISIFLWVANSLIYAIFLSWYCLPTGQIKDVVNQLMIWTIISAEIGLAILILSYTILLYRQFPLTMKNLLFSSILCFICLTLKPVFILILEYELDGVYTPWLYPTYFCGSELTPYITMLYLDFVDRTKTNDHTGVYSSLIGSSPIHTVPSGYHSDGNTAIQHRSSLNEV